MPPNWVVTMTMTTPTSSALWEIPRDDSRAAARYGAAGLPGGSTGGAQRCRATGEPLARRPAGRNASSTRPQPAERAGYHRAGGAGGDAERGIGELSVSVERKRNSTRPAATGGAIRTCSGLATAFTRICAPPESRRVARDRPNLREPVFHHGAVAGRLRFRIRCTAYPSVSDGFRIHSTTGNERR